MDLKIHFSFLKLFNHLKGVSKPMPADQYDLEYLKKKADKKTKEKFKKFFAWCKEAGITHPKVQYPVMFGKGDNTYAGMIALNDIGTDEAFIKVPSKVIISTKVAYECKELNHIFYDHPDVFGKHVSLGDDNVLDAFILYHIEQEEKSAYYHTIQSWPEDADILMNWDDDDLEWLQDPTLAEDAVKGSEEMMVQWEKLYKVLKKYPELFPETAISMYKFKWVYILTTNRCFGSNWPGVCQMVPYADFVNHENVDTGFDCLDMQGNSLEIPQEEKDKKNDAESGRVTEEQKDFLTHLKTDLLEMEVDLRRQMLQEGHVTQTEEAKNDQEISLKLLQATTAQYDAQKQTLKEEAEKKQEMGVVKIQKEGGDDGDVSSGLESDNDIDLLVEQEVLNKKKTKMNYPRPVEHGSVAGKGEKEISLSKEEAKRIWELTLSNVPEEYDFVVKTGKDPFPAGSQVFLCYGRMSNREMLKRYGFCLPQNKYNNIYIKLKLEMSDPDFKYRQFILRKFFGVENESDRTETDGQAIEVQSRHFKVFYQKFNMKILKFLKILNFNVKEDDINCIIETRSLSLEYISLQKLMKIYQDFLNSFATSLKEDLVMMRDPVKMKKLTYRNYFAMTFRTEQKRILINQIKLIKVIMHILERLMKGMTLEFAVTRIFELESRKEHPINRLMIDNFLTALQRGLQKNQATYFEQKQKQTEHKSSLAISGEDMLRATQKELRFDMAKQAYRQFEIKGYEKMIERIMEAPLQASQSKENSDLRHRLLDIQEALLQQKTKCEQYENEVENVLLNQKLMQQRKEAAEAEEEGEESGSSYYDEEEESEEEQEEEKDDVKPIKPTRIEDPDKENKQIKQNQEEEEVDSDEEPSKIDKIRQEWQVIQSIAKNDNKKSEQLAEKKDGDKNQISAASAPTDYFESY